MDSFRRLVVSFKINYSIDEHLINSSVTTSHLSLIVPHTNNYIQYMMSLYLCHPTVTSYLLVTFIVIWKRHGQLPVKKGSYVGQSYCAILVCFHAVPHQLAMNYGGGLYGYNCRKSVV